MFRNNSKSRIQGLVKKNKLLLSCGTGGLTAVVATAATHAAGTAAGYSGGAALLHGAAVLGGAIGCGAAAAPVVIGAAAVVATVATVKAIESIEEGGGEMKQRLPVEIAPVHDDGLYVGFLIRVGGGQLTRREVEGWYLRHHPLVRRAVEVILAFVGCNTSVATAPIITRWGGSACEMTGVTAMLRVILGRGAKVSVVPAAHVARRRMPF